MPLHASSSPRRRGYNTGLHYTFCRDRVTVGENKSSAPERTLQEGLRKTHTSSQLLGNAARCVNTISYAFQCRKHSSQSYLQRPAGSPQLMPVGCLQALTGRACLAACASSLLRAVSSCPTCVLFACVPGLSQPASQFTLLSWPEACFYGARGVWTANLLCTQKHIALHSVNIRPYTSLTALCFMAGVYFGFVAPDNGRNQSWAVPALVGALLLASVALLLVTALLDPGFVPRNTNPKDAELGYGQLCHTLLRAVFCSGDART